MPFCTGCGKEISKNQALELDNRCRECAKSFPQLKCKIFLTQYYGGITQETQNLINDWLKENSNVKIKFITQVIENRPPAPNLITSIFDEEYFSEKKEE
ncbi:MAG: hypothetical protein KGD74_02420 [Candidatus Lokiarchaeota archaeon]|nr:hypothetical protein [Candidatus Lokiarchaeota archaeon]